MEIPAEIVSSALFGVHAGTLAPLIATAIAYAITVAVSIVVIEKRALR
jgi:hypothetical protein